MTSFVAVALFGVPGVVDVPAQSAAALALPGLGSPDRGGVAGFGYAAATPAAGAPAVHARHEVIVTGDVRLDGRAALLRSVRAAGVEPAHGAQQAPDDLTLVRLAYEAWGQHMVERLRGEFSFVLWDGASNTLIAARDGLGVRPLYHAVIPNGVCVSNALDAVRAHPSVGTALNDAAVASFLALGWNDNQLTTTFSAIARLPPGGMLRRSRGDSAPVPAIHWTMPGPATITYRRAGEYVAHFRALLDEAVRDRVTGPTAILLSGGLDSQSIAATAARVAPGQLVYALTTRMPAVETADEARLAATVATRLGLRHELREFDVFPAPGEGPRTPEPYDDFELQATSEFYSAIAVHAPVLLIGEDGDALFSPPSLSVMLRTYPPWRVAWWLLSHSLRTGHHPYLGFWLARRLRFWRHEQPRMTPEWMVRGGGSPLPEASAPVHGTRPDAARMLSAAIWQRVHQGTDRAFHGAPIDVRWPLLDSRLLEFIFSIPPVPWCQRKHLLRRAYAEDLPAEVVHRRKTTVSGYVEHAVAEWRRRTGGAFAPLHARTREFVDSGRLAATLADGSAEAVLAGWRALVLDRWFRHQEAL